MGALLYTVSICKDRWKNMKDTFSTNWNKVSSSNKRCSGAAPEDLYVPRWPLYQKLMFLKKTVVAGATMNNIPISTQTPESVEQATMEETSTSSNTNVIEVYFNETLQKFLPIPADAEFQLVPQSHELEESTSTASTPPAPASTQGQELYVKRGKRRASQMSEVLSLAKELVKPLPEPALPAPVENDSATNLGLYIAGRLRDMSPASRKSCEKDLMTAMLKY